MPLESANFISDLNAANPTATDPKNQGDDHIRLVKSAVKATFPNVSGAVTPTHTELNFVDGVTSPIQAQINALDAAKAPVANPSFTGNASVTGNQAVGGSLTVGNGASVTGNVSATGSLTVGGGASFGTTPTAPTLPANTATTQLATTAMVQNAILASTGISAQLPGQNGNAGRLLTTNGTSASWGGYFKVAPRSGGALQAGTLYSLETSASYTAEDITGNPFGFFNGSGSSLTANVTFSDGWSSAISVSADSFRVPTSTFTPHGTWGSTTLTPNTLALLSASGVSAIRATVSLSPSLAIVMYIATGGTFVVAVDLVNNQFGTPVSVSSDQTSAVGAVLYREGSADFVAGGASTGPSGFVVACTVSGLTITAGTPVAFNHAVPMIQLAAGSYLGHSNSTTGLTAFSVSGTTVTVGSAVATGVVTAPTSPAWSGTDFTTKIWRVSDTVALVAYLAAGGGTATTRQLAVRTASVSGTTITLNTAATGSNIYNSNANNGIRLLYPYQEGASYLLCAIDTVSTVGNWHGITVSGTTVTLGAANVQSLNAAVNFNVQTYIYQPVQRVYRFNSTTILSGNLSGGPFAITISGTTLTFGSSGGPAGASAFLTDAATSSNVYAVNSGGSGFISKLSVSGTTVTATWNVATTSTTTFVQSDTVNNQAVNYDGNWYSWSVSVSTALSTTKNLRTATDSIRITGVLL